MNMHATRRPLTIWTITRVRKAVSSGEMTRTARELWAYMRNVTANDPNWILDDVEEAN